MSAAKAPRRPIGSESSVVVSTRVCCSISRCEWIAQQITEAFPLDQAPHYLIHDRYTVYGAAATRRMRAMGIRDRPITLRSPWQNGHVERLIGSVRRDCLDHVVVLGESHFRRLLANTPATITKHIRTLRLTRCSAPPTRAHRRAHHISRLARRPSSPVRADGIIGSYR